MKLEMSSTIVNNGSWFLSLSWISVNISVLLLGLIALGPTPCPCPVPVHCKYVINHSYGLKMIGLNITEGSLEEFSAI